MRKTITLMAGLLTMGVASLAYADFIHLGAGACRTPSGGAGTFNLHTNVSWVQCRNLCIQNANCRAVEYGIRENGAMNCEVHTAPINQTVPPEFSPERLTSCWLYTD